jgi:hypothetical protein
VIKVMTTRLGGKAVPHIAACLDNVVVFIKDADREPVGPQVLPDVLHRVQLRAIRQERDERDIVRQDLACFIDDVSNARRLH